MNEVTRILSDIEAGDPAAAEQLLPLVYDELRKLASARLANEKSGQTLQATALVHEAYLRLVGPNQSQRWNSRGHFFGAAAEAMRRILVDQARRKKTLKHGGTYQRADLSINHPGTEDRVLDLVALDQALEQLEAERPRQAELVKLRFFAGLSVDQAAEVLGVSSSTADTDWSYAKAWLRLAIEGEE